MKNYFTNKAMIILCMVFMVAHSSKGQNFYVKFSGGYGLGSSPDAFGMNNSSQTGNLETNTKVNLTLGTGVNVAGTLGYSFNENIGTELGVSYFMGSSSSFKSSYSGSFSSESYSAELSGKMLMVVPSLVLSHTFNRIKPYAKFGLIVGLGSATIKNDYEEVDISNNDKDYGSTTTKLSGGLALGLNSAIGISYEINDRISLFGELQNVNLNYSPKQGEVTKSSLNGVDNLSTLKPREIKTEFTDSYTIDRSQNPDENAPSKEISPNLPFSNIGFNLGITINLN
jgi:hypothetical protein